MHDGAVELPFTGSESDRCCPHHASASRTRGPGMRPLWSVVAAAGGRLWRRRQTAGCRYVRCHGARCRAGSARTVLEVPARRSPISTAVMTTTRRGCRTSNKPSDTLRAARSAERVSRAACHLHLGVITSDMGTKEAIAPRRTTIGQIGNADAAVWQERALQVGAATRWSPVVRERHPSVRRTRVRTTRATSPTCSPR